jgi:predicted MFS family arabinose efflux permease
MISTGKTAALAAGKTAGPLAPGETPGETSAGPVVVAGLIALAVAMGIGRFAFTPVLPMMQDAGLSIEAGGWLASANYAGYLVGSLLAVVVGMKPAAAIRCGLFAIVVSTAAMGMTENFYAWAVLRGLAGVASAFVLVFCSAWFLEKLAALGKSSLNGVAFAGVGAGIMGAGLVCLVLVHLEAGYSRAWWSLGLVAAVFTAAVWNSFSAEEGRAGARSGEPAGTGAADGAPAWSLDGLRLVACYGAFGFGYIIPATFLPVMARRVIADPAVMGWAWPVFGLAAALSTVLAAKLRASLQDRDLWAGSHLIMAAGVAMPAIWHGLAAILGAALCVGGTTMVVTMAGVQEARRVGGAHARSLIGALTSAFAIGQIAGPLCVSALNGRPGGFAQALLVACGVLVASALALAWPRQRVRSQEA